MGWLVLNLVFGVFATLLILGILSAGMRLEYGKRSERGNASAQVVETRATDREADKVAA
ncbi:MAG: hypothetical protein M0Z91_07650 [Actinomycetota bacterium]|nr:hypothetical protein [Actinomycetota bacterium]